MGREAATEARTQSLHSDFEHAFRGRVGRQFSRSEIAGIMRETFGNFPAGSVVPTDHAEPSVSHVNQCRKCADPEYQIFETVIEGNRKSGLARYRVRDFKSFPDRRSYPVRPEHGGFSERSNSESVIERLMPCENQRIMDLVAAAGIDVENWARSSKGFLKSPASNPAYCYEWAFVEPGRVVVLNVWHREIREQNGKVWCILNLRALAEEWKHAETLKSRERITLSKRAMRMDDAIACAFNDGLPVRLVVGEGSRRNISGQESKASRMTLRLLDPEPWSVQSYDQDTGECRLIRGAAPQYVDQHTVRNPKSSVRREVTGKVWERDRKVRDTALARAKGRCELCEQTGFRMAGGGIYLETHHVIPLSEDGIDHERNVVALCANDHREAHHGERRDAIRAWLIALLAEMYGDEAKLGANLGPITAENHALGSN